MAKDMTQGKEEASFFLYPAADRRQPAPADLFTGRQPDRRQLCRSDCAGLCGHQLSHYVSLAGTGYRPYQRCWCHGISLDGAKCGGIPEEPLHRMLYAAGRRYSDHHSRYPHQQAAAGRTWQADASILDDALLYLRIYCIGLVFQFAYNTFAAILRSIGDSRSTMYFLLATGEDSWI